MARNILIFSDGTGQVGGYDFDEDRTNVYKLFRQHASALTRPLIRRSRPPFTTRVSALVVKVDCTGTLGALDIQKGQPSHWPWHHPKHH